MLKNHLDSKKYVLLFLREHHVLKSIIDARVTPNTQPILRKTQFTFHSIRPKKNLTNAIARKKK